MTNKKHPDNDHIRQSVFPSGFPVGPYLACQTNEATFDHTDTCKNKSTLLCTDSVQLDGQHSYCRKIQIRNKTTRASPTEISSASADGSSWKRCLLVQQSLVYLRATGCSGEGNKQNSTGILA